MPLKPIYDKSPLTALTALPLRPAQAAVSCTAAAQLYALVKEARDQYACWEGAIRLGAALGCKEADIPAAARTRLYLSMQAEDGGLPLTPADAVCVMRAAMALYEMKAERPVIEQLLRFCGWLKANWESVMADRAVRTASADLMELLENIYRVTGKKPLLALCEKLRHEALDWSGVLHTFAVQRPMSRVTPAADLTAGMDAEDGSEAGFYTRQYLTCHAAKLADGARAATMNGLYSGNGMELTAAKTGWERISRYHGAVCGGLTADETVAGTSPAAAVDAVSLGAWAEAFAVQGQTGENAWAFDALDTLLCNGLPAAVSGDKLVPYQRVNGLEANCGTKDCYLTGDADAHVWAALARLSRGWAAALQSAVMTREDGFTVNLCVPGTYLLPVDGKACRVRIAGEHGAFTIVLDAKASVQAKVRVRIPVWTNDAAVSVNDEGADEGKPGAYLTIDRTWNPGDTIKVAFAQNLRTVEGHHQGAAVLLGATVLAVPASRDNWAYAIVGAPEMKDGVVTVPAAPVADWRCKGAVPADLPVLPRVTGETVRLTLKPYAETPCRIALLPKGRQA